MATSIVTGPYEVLVRFGPDFNIKGAHVQFARAIVIDGVVEKWEPKDPIPFPLEDNVVEAIERLLVNATDIDFGDLIIEGANDVLSNMKANIQAAALMGATELLNEISNNSGHADFSEKLRASITRQNLGDVAVTIASEGEVAPSFLSRIKTAILG